MIVAASLPGIVDFERALGATERVPAGDRCYQLQFDEAENEKRGPKFGGKSGCCDATKPTMRSAQGGEIYVIQNVNRISRGV